jgi:hypothetical protein
LKHDRRREPYRGDYTYNSAKPDGLFVGTWNGALVLRQALGDKAVRLDGRKLGWIGSPTKGTPICGIMAYTGLKTLDDIVASNREIKMGATGPGSTYEDLPQMLNLTLGTQFKVISGYGEQAQSLWPCAEGKWTVVVGPGSR